METPDELALRDLLQRMHWVRGLAGALVRDADRADDLAQDAWVKALRAGPAQAGSWRGWFARVMKNRVADEGRLKGQQERFTARQPRSGGGPSEEEILQQMETHEALSEALRNLPDPYRRAVFLHYFEGWSLGRIAAEDGCDKRAIEKRLRQARAMLRAHLERRAPAAHWAAGLLLLARSTSIAVPVALAAVVVLTVTATVVFAEFWNVDGAPGTPVVALPSVTTAAGAAADTGDPTSPPGSGLVAGEIEREEAGSDGFDFILTIRDLHSQAPISGASVELRTHDEYDRTLERAELASDVNGEVRHRFLQPASRAMVTLAAPGRYHSATNLFNWQTVSSEVRKDALLAPLQGAVQGRIVDERGFPVSGAWVDLWQGGSEMGPNGPDPAFTVAADAEGMFRVEPAFSESGRLLLVPRAEGMAPTRAFEVGANVAANAEVSGIELVLAAGRPLRVHVADELGRPIEGARVSIWPAYGSDPSDRLEHGQIQGRRSLEQFTGADGWTKWVMATREPWQVNARHDFFGRTETQVVSVEQSEASVLLPLGRLVEGVLLAPDGLPLPGTLVEVETAEDQLQVRTAEDGSFRLAVPGNRGDEVRLQIMPTRRLAHHVVGPIVPEDAQQPLAITLQPGATLSVALVLADGTPFPAMNSVEWDVLDGPRTRAPGGDAGTEQSWFKLREPSFFEFGFYENTFYASGSPLGSYTFRFWTSDGWSGQALLTAGVKSQRIVMAQP